MLRAQVPEVWYGNGQGIIVKNGGNHCAERGQNRTHRDGFDVRACRRLPRRIRHAWTYEWPARARIRNRRQSLAGTRIRRRARSEASVLCYRLAGMDALQLVSSGAWMPGVVPTAGPGVGETVARAKCRNAQVGAGFDPAEAFGNRPRAVDPEGKGGTVRHRLRGPTGELSARSVAGRLSVVPRPGGDRADL